MCDILEAPERSASRGQDSAKYKGQVKKTAGRGNKEGVCDLEGSQWNCGDGNMIQADSTENAGGGGCSLALSALLPHTPKGASGL